MSNTIRTGGTRDGEAALATGRRSYFTTERKAFRKETNRRTRHAVAEMLRTGADHDDAAYPRHPATGGWLTH